MSMMGLGYILVIASFCFFTVGCVHLVFVAVAPPTIEFNELTPAGAAFFGFCLISIGVLCAWLSQMVLT